MHTLSAILIRWCLPFFIRYVVLRNWPVSFRVFVRGSLLEPDRFHLLFSDWDVGLVAPPCTTDQLRQLQSQLSRWKKWIPQLSEFELYTEQELAEQTPLPAAFETLRWCRKILDLQLRISKEPSLFAKIKHRRALKIAHLRLAKLMPLPADKLEPTKQVMQGLEFFLAQMIINPLPNSQDLAENLLSTHRWHDLLNIQIQTENYQVSASNYLHLFLFLLGGTCLDPLYLQDPILRQFLIDSEDIRRNFLKHEILKLTAFLRTISEPPPWLLERRAKLEKALLFCLPPKHPQNKALAPIQKYLGKNASFLEIGGVWGQAHDIFAAVATQDVSRLAQLDLVPISAPEWKHLESRVKLSGGRDFTKLSQDFLDYNGPTYDMVYCSHVIIHLSDLEAFFAKLKNVCEQILILRTLFAHKPLNRSDDIYWIRNLRAEERNDLFHQLQIPEMKQNFLEPDPEATADDRSLIWNLPIENGLIRLLNKNGFQVVEKSYELNQRILCLTANKLSEVQDLDTCIPKIEH